METFAEPRPLVANPAFAAQKRKSLADLTDDVIDPPIAVIVARFNQLPCCFTLQSCFGHFLYPGQKDPFCCDPLPDLPSGTKVDYKIAYLALCLEDSGPGRRLLENLRTIPQIDPDNIQFCSADWFWNSQVNSYALQVEPDRFKRQDTAVFGFEEALRVEKTRIEFFRAMEALSRTGGA